MKHLTIILLIIPMFCAAQNTGSLDSIQTITLPGILATEIQTLQADAKPIVERIEALEEAAIIKKMLNE